MNVPILMYHNISDDKKDKTSVFYKDFYAQIKFMTKLKYKSFRLKDIDKDDYKKKFIVTFDDGYQNISKIAQEILFEFDQTATCFVVANRINLDNNWDKFSDHKIYKTKLMTDIQIKEWISNGNELGSHTLDHLDLTKLKYEDKEYQINHSLKILNKKFKINIRSFAYPYGKYDDACLELLKSNYKYAVTTNKSLYNKMHDKPFEMPRVSISSKTSIFKFFLKTLTLYENLR